MNVKTNLIFVGKNAGKPYIFMVKSLAVRYNKKRGGNIRAYDKKVFLLQKSKISYKIKHIYADKISIVFYKHII